VSYYQGDFYQGDPGFFSFLKKAVGIGASFIPGVGGVAGKLLGAGAPSGAGRAMTVARGTIARVGGLVAKHPVLSGAAAAGTIGMLGAGAGRATARMGSAGMGRGGMRLSKRTGMPVRSRRMHVTNVKALRRAIRRCTGFAHLAKRVLRFTSPRPPRGRAIFKHRRKKRTV
jgi:hypothetical protein